MARNRMRALALVPVALTVAVMACSHAPVTPGSPVAREVPTRRPVLVTGSRIPQWVDSSSVLPATISPVMIYSRAQILATGHPEDLGAALQSLDPSVQIEHR